MITVRGILSVRLLPRILIEDWRRFTADFNMVSMHTGFALLFSYTLLDQQFGVNEQYSRSFVLLVWQLNYLKHFLGGGFVKHMQVGFLALGLLASHFLRKI